MIAMPVPPVHSSACAYNHIEQSEEDNLEQETSQDHKDTGRKSGT